MARVLILYGTTDGQTGKIARFLARAFEQRGAGADVMDARSASPNPAHYDAVVVAASVHAQGYQRAVQSWVRTHLDGLKSRPSAFLSVCLGVLQKDEAVQRDLERIKSRFIATTGWTPPLFKFVPGALLYTKYGWLKRMVMKRIVRKAGGDTDVTRDYEYTDWVDLERFADAFLTSVSLVAPAPAACECSVPVPELASAG